MAARTGLSPTRCSPTCARWAWHRFCGDITGHSTFDGLTIPSAGRLGWPFGTDRWPDGEFFRYEITELRLASKGHGRAS